MKPRVFIGSSTEGLRIAEAVFASLSHETEPTLWTHQLFLPGQYPLEVLEKQLHRHSFAILVASPDDEVIKRGESFPAMRDNLLLEFGLFTGAIGRRRVFFICPSSPRISLPSDLVGVITAIYDAGRVNKGGDGIAAAVQVATHQIREVIREEWQVLQASLAEESNRLRTTHRGQAIQRLNGVAVQLRDALIVLQRETFAALSDDKAFAEAKQSAATRFLQIADSYGPDAQVAGVESELSALVEVTVGALHDLPFPRELALGRNAATQRAVDVGVGALNAFLRGGDPMRHVTSAASQEAEGRFESLKERYAEWWDRHCPTLQEKAADLQDALFRGALQLAIAQH